MSSRVVREGTLTGLLSGTILGLGLKMVEVTTNLNVYTLLLNVDFIPIIGSVQWNEVIEFAFHLIIAVVIGIVYMYLRGRLELERFRSLLLVAVVLGFPTIFLYFPLSFLAIKDVPSWDDYAAFFWWSLIHILYIFSLPVLTRLLPKQ
ncbi:hypothetical protein [Paenisporosarcina cavernae]|uniref:DUF1440 domain-containing protein n=1 Tax=Paenisporosarcina cavernae TaxID=2320858 RepID=A0A385YTW4_9BACL|nr:hypothetical protein [Paenisporosarcina cavernae]AYC29118.1 hypothetical protein D3873_04200 [Paenisporosarcina cavernae]